MLVVGCTGGIGSGKSTVAALLGERGAVVVDADAIARAALEPSEAAFAAVVERFGPAIVGEDGRLDRSGLAELVFRDPIARADLEAIVHPVVRRAIADRLEAERAGERVVVLDVPLLVETGGKQRYGVDAVLVVDAPEHLAVERLVSSRRMTREAARARAAAQVPRAERLRAADYVIVNIGSLDELVLMVDAAWRWIGQLRLERSGAAGAT
ncbi:MAG TPA: dephospho-CoA kinase [Acidimicrobiales bacterium]|nr:dephospho-CoA kinase [Acidimicrobiales bacterium]